MNQHNYHETDGKLMVLMASQSLEAFKKWYFDIHQNNILHLENVSEYIANVKSEHEGSSPLENKKLEPYGVMGVDEIKGVRWDEVRSLYADVKIIGAYIVTEYLVKELHTDRPVGHKSPELKSMSMLSRPVNKSLEQALDYWLNGHSIYALRHHTGMACYYQNHIRERLTEDSAHIDGFPMALYWNEDARKWGTFSRPDSKELWEKDIVHFRSTSYRLLLDEYIMRRPASWWNGIN